MSLTHHLTGLNDINDQIEVRPIDQPGAGGGHHQYILSSPKCEEDGLVTFHQPDANRHGVLTGYTIEAYLTPLLHRLECFQAGPFACEENAVALDHGLKMMEALRQRTARRNAAGLEGKLEENSSLKALPDGSLLGLQNDELVVGNLYRTGVSLLRDWKQWSTLESEIKRVCMGGKKLTSKDVALLEELSGACAGANRGWIELKQALTQANLM